MPYSDDETRAFRPEDVEAIRRKQAEERRQAEERYREEARIRQSRQYAADQERRRTAQREQERRERQRRDAQRRKRAKQAEARRKKAALDKQKQKDQLLLEAAEGAPLSGKLFLTLQQKKSLLRWSLDALVFFLVLIVQNVIFSRITLFGCVINLVPGAILLIGLCASVESGCIFALCASLFWSFSGWVLGSVSVFLLPLFVALLGALRQACFPKTITSILLCCFIGMVGHEFIRFLAALFLDYTPWGYWYQALVTPCFSFLVCPVLYPVVRAISKIGGPVWSD